MSDLQLSLFGLGLLFVAGVFTYNKWQERKHRKLVERVFRSDHPDVLLGTRHGEPVVPAPASAQRIEPVLSGLSEAEERSVTQVRQEAVETVQAMPVADEPPEELADPAVDCVVRFESAEMIGGAYLWQAQLQAFEKLTRALSWCGLNEDSGQWERLSAHGAADYRQLRAALQLADRRGPLNDHELTLFLNGMQRLADGFLAVAGLPERNEVLVRAAEIDRFCASVDIQIGVNIVSSDVSFAGTKLRALAEAAGMVLRGDGMFHVCDETGATLFTFSNLEALPFASEEMKGLSTFGVTFTLDVPRVSDAPRVFDSLITQARQFAASLGGTLVDDNRAPLSDGALDVIRDKVIDIGERMASQGLTAGSRQALRLFS